MGVRGRVTDGTWMVTNSSWRVIDGCWRVTNGTWRVTNGSWRVTNGTSKEIGRSVWGRCLLGQGEKGQGLSVVATQFSTSIALLHIAAELRQTHRCPTTRTPTRKWGSGCGWWDGVSGEEGGGGVRRLPTVGYEAQM